MQIQVLEKSIGGTTYKVRQLGAITGSEVMCRLAAMAGGAAKGGNLGDIIANALANLKAEDFRYLCDIMAKQTDVRVDGKTLPLADVFDLHFAGAYDDMVLWLAFALEVNFRKAFLGLRARVAELFKAFTSTSPAASTGTSGAS